MKPDEREHLADRLLDTGLKQYADAEPRPGLEDRILANLRAEQARVSAPRWWPTVAAVAAVLLIAITLWFARKPGRTTPTVTANHAPAVPAVGNQTASGIATSMPRAHFPAVSVARFQPKPHVRQSVALPKLEQFPSARPLSKQEKLMLAYVQQTPKEELLAVATKQQQEISNLHIEKLVIPPLDIDKPTTESNEKN